MLLTNLPDSVSLWNCIDKSRLWDCTILQGCSQSWLECTVAMKASISLMDSLPEQSEKKGCHQSNWWFILFWRHICCLHEAKMQFWEETSSKNPMKWPTPRRKKYAMFIIYMEQFKWSSDISTKTDSNNMEVLRPIFKQFKTAKLDFTRPWSNWTLLRR